MEGKNESKHTPEDKVAIRVPNIRIPAGYSRDISAAILDYQSECNAILKEQTKRIKELEGRIRVETLLFEQLSEMKKEYREKLEKERQAFDKAYFPLQAEVDRLTNQLKESEENYAGMTTQCKYLTEINVFNMCFDKADSHWRKSHKVEEGENFIDWYMRHHAAEREADRKQIDGLTKDKSELVSVLTDFTAWCEYPDVSKVLGMSQATIFHTAKDLLTRIKS